MGKMLVAIDDEVEMKIRALALQKYGKTRGSISRLVEDALRRILDDKLDKT